MKILIFCLLLSPADTLPSKDSLINSLTEFYQNQTIAQIEEFKNNEKYGWIKYIPSIGAGYTIGTDKNGNLTNKLRPSASFNLINIYSYFNKKQRNKQKIKSIALTNQNELINQILQLENALQNLQLLQQKIQRKEELLIHEKEELDIETQLFQIQKDKYKRNELLPSQFLSMKKRYINAQQKLNNKQYEIEELQHQVQLKQLEILMIAKVHQYKITLHH